MPLNLSDQTIFQLPAGPLGCTDACAVDVGLGELPPTDEMLGAGELLLPDDGDLDELGDGLVELLPDDGDLDELGLTW